MRDDGPTVARTVAIHCILDRVERHPHTTVADRVDVDLEAIRVERGDRLRELGR